MTVDLQLKTKIDEYDYCTTVIFNALAEKLRQELISLNKVSDGAEGCRSL